MLNAKAFAIARKRELDAEALARAMQRVDAEAPNKPHPPKVPRNPVMRLILEEARRRGARPPPQQMLDWLKATHHHVFKPPSKPPSAASIGRMLSRYL